MVARLSPLQDEPMLRLGFFVWIMSSFPVSLVLGRAFRRIGAEEVAENPKYGLRIPA